MQPFRIVLQLKYCPGHLACVFGLHKHTGVCLLQDLAGLPIDAQDDGAATSPGIKHLGGQRPLK